MRKVLLGFFLLGSVTFARNLTLEEAIDLSLNNSKEMKISEKNLEISKLNVNVALKQALPKVTYTGTYTRGEYERSMIRSKYDANTISARSGYNQYLTITQPLFTGGVVTAAIKGANATKKVAEYNYLLDKINTRLEAIKLYSDILNAEKDLESLKKSEKILQDRYNKQKAQLELRLITKPDVLRTEYSLLEVQSSIISTQNTLNINKERLYIKTGIAKSEDLILENFDIPSNLSSMTNYDKDLNQAIQDSLKAKIAEEEVKISKAKKLAAAGDFLPKVSAFASYGTGNGERRHYEKTYEEAEWTGGVQVTWNVFSFGESIDNYRVAKLQTEQQELREVSSKEDIEINVKDAYFNLLRLEKLKESQKSAYEAAKLTFEMDEEKYDAGLIDAIDYLTSENNYRTASINYNKTLLDYYYAFEAYRSLLI